MKVIVPLVCFAALALAEIDSENNPNSICGLYLASVLAVICNDERNPRIYLLSNAYRGNGNTIEKPASKPRYGDAWMHIREAWLPKFARSRRGVAHECCTRGCTLNELHAYCIFDE